MEVDVILLENDGDVTPVGRDRYRTPAAAWHRQAVGRSRPAPACRCEQPYREPEEICKAVK